MIPSINRETCATCGDCVDACPGQVFARKDDGIQIISPEECIECRACEEVCPTGAVRLVDG